MSGRRGEDHSSPDKIEWRLMNLEDSHKLMQDSFKTMSDTLLTLVTEMKTSRKIMMTVVSIVAVIEPAIFHYYK